MKDILKHRRLAAGYSRILCRPLCYSDKQEIVYSSPFPVNGYTIALRPLNILTDLTLAYEWLRLTYARNTWKSNGPVKQLEEVYTQMMQCDFAQPFMVLQDNKPVCVAEFHHARHHEVGLYYESQPGDYAVSLLLSPDKKKDK